MRSWLRPKLFGFRVPGTTSDDCTSSSHPHVAMPTSVSGSNTSSRSKKGSLAASSGSCDILEKGPVTKNGIVYLKVRRCPLCRLLNTDPNPVKSGPLAASPTVVWHQGNATNPTGRVDRICFIVFSQGGFAEQFESLDAFLQARKEQRALMEEWQTSYGHVVKLGDELPVRMGKVFTQKLCSSISLVRKEAVETFRLTQQRVKNAYRCVRKDVYEKRHPGKVDKKGYTVKPFLRNGKWVDCVLIPKEKDGEFELEIEEVAGTAHRQEYDNGDWEIRAGQADKKYQALASKQHLTKADLDGLASDSSSCGSSHAEGAAKSDDDDDDRSVSERDSEEADDDLAWVTSSILDSVAQKSGAAKPAAAKSGAKLAPKGLKGAQRKATPGSTPPRRLPSTRSTTASPDDTVRRKFRGKSAEDILEPHGWPKLKETIEEVVLGMQSSGFESMLTGGALENYMAEAKDLRLKASNLQRSIVSLDIKVKKWKECPDSVLAFLGAQRSRSKALSDALNAFSGVQKSADAQRMEAAIVALKQVDIKVPKAFDVFMFKEKACDLIRFRHLDSFVEHVQCDGRGYIQQGMFADTDALRDLILDVHADALKTLIQGCELDPRTTSHALHVRRMLCSRT